MRNSIDFFRGHHLPTWNEEWASLFGRSLNHWDTKENQADVIDFEPQVDIHETATSYVVHVDVPGLKKEDIKIDVSKNALTISGERKRENGDYHDGVHRFERAYGKFQRTFAIPNTVDSEKIEAGLEAGVLTLSLPKSDIAKPRTVEIQSNRVGISPEKKN